MFIKFHFGLSTIFSNDLFLNCLIVHNDKEKVVNLSDTMDIEEAVCLTGYGKFHWELLSACALSILSVGFQNGLAAYILSAAQCELHLTSGLIGLLNVLFLIGGILSSFLWGVLADNSGRKKVLLVTHFMNAATLAICAIHSTVYSLIICRFLNGFFIGGPGSIIFSYLAEFQPSKYRASVIGYCGLFFTLSWLLLPVMAWMILPTNIDIRFFIWVLSPWRIFLILIAVPELLVGFWFMRLPESPKFYVAKDDAINALQVLKRMYHENTGSCTEDFPVKNLKMTKNNESCGMEKIACRGGKFIRITRDVITQIKSLFRPPLTYVSILTCTIMFANMFGIFGLGLWLPEIFTRYENYQSLHPNATVILKDLSHVATAKTEICNPSFDPSVIQTTVAMGVCSIVANALSGWSASKLSIKTIPLISMLIGGISTGAIYWLTSSLKNLITACLFQSSMVVANMTIGGVVVQLFPTNIGGMAICLVMCAGRLGAMASNTVFGFFMDSHCEVPILLVATVITCGGLLCFMIPNTCHQSSKNPEDEEHVNSFEFVNKAKSKDLENAD